MKRDDPTIALHKAERRAETAIDLLARLYTAAMSTPHLQQHDRKLQLECLAFLEGVKHATN
jgi:hypothetical protein